MDFYTHLRWKGVAYEQQQEAAGITWLELFLLYHRHGGNLNDDKDVLGNKNTLQKDVAAFKKLSLNVFNMTCPPEDERIMKPSYARRNRLRSIAVSNKHASIKGMPVITDEENSQIVKRLLSMRGLRSPKQKKA